MEKPGDMMAAPGGGLARWIEPGKWIGILWLVPLLYVLSPGAPWVAALLAVVLAAASPVFVLVATLVVTGAITGRVLLLGGAADNTVLLVALAVLASVFTWRRGLLDRADKAPYLVRLLGRVRWLFLVAGLVSLSLLLFQSIPMHSALCWGVMFLCVYRELPRHETTPEDAGQWGWANQILLFAAVLFSILVLEWGARFAYPDFRTLGETELFMGIFRFHPEYLYVTKPNGHLNYPLQISETKTLMQPLEISSQGFRDRMHAPKAPDEFRILMLGDSFTMGVTVTVDKTIPAWLEMSLKKEMPTSRISVVNAGLAGAGPLGELGMLREYGWAQNPDLVILQVYPANDIIDSLDTIGKNLRAYDLEWQEAMRKMWIKRAFPYRADWWLNRHCAVYHALADGVFRDSFVAGMLCDLRCYHSPTLPPLPPNESRRPLLESNLIDWYPELEEGFGLFKKYVREIRDDCERHGVDLVAFCIPEISEMDDAKWAELDVSCGGRSKYEPFKALRLIYGFFDEEKIPSVSMIEPLRTPGNSDSFYFPYDRHLTSEGNRVVAERLRDFLLKEYPPKHRPIPKPSE